MMACRDDARQGQAPQTHAAHERAEQDAERDRRRSDDQLQQLEPDDFVNQRGAAAADKQQQEHGQAADARSKKPPSPRNGGCYHDYNEPWGENARQNVGENGGGGIEQTPVG